MSQGTWAGDCRGSRIFTTSESRRESGRTRQRNDGARVVRRCGADTRSDELRTIAALQMLGIIPVSRHVLIYTITSEQDADATPSHVLTKPRHRRPASPARGGVGSLYESNEVLDIVVRALKTKPDIRWPLNNDFRNNRERNFFDPRRNFCKCGNFGNGLRKPIGQA